jgi:hypothetical protein
VDLYWNPSPSPNIAGYNIYQGAGDGTYTNEIQLGNVTNVLVSNIQPSVTYYFAAAAINSSGIQSQLSSQTSYLYSVSPPPTNLTYVGVQFNYGTALTSITSSEFQLMIITNNPGYYFSQQLVLTNNPLTGNVPDLNNEYLYIDSIITYGLNLISLTNNEYQLMIFTNPPAYYYSEQLILTNLPFGNPPTSNQNWTPSSQLTLVQWNKSDSGVVVSGNNNVSSWNSSGGSQNLTLVTPSGYNIPTVISNGLNNLPVISFTGRNYCLQSPVFSQGIAQPFTVMLVYSWNAPVGNSTGYNILWSGVTSDPTLYVTDETSDQFFIFGNTFGSIVDNNYHFMFMVVNSNSTEYAMDNGNIIAINGLASDTNALTGLGLGINSGAGSMANFNIAEIAIWSGDGSSFESEAHSYCQQKWGSN